MIIESLSGVRAHEDKMTKKFIQSYGLAFFEKTNARRIVIGRDTRKSGKKIQKTLINTLQAAGVKVIDVGICPTPTVQYATYFHQAEGGIVITASHNPLPWNGLKFINSEGLFLNAEQMKELQERRKELDGKVPEKPREKLPEVIQYSDAVKNHIETILFNPYLNIDKIKEKNFKVVIDAVNGAAYDAAPELLKTLGCEVIAINCKSDIVFPRTPEPVPENLSELEQKVTTEQADIGFAVDPDADRLAIVTNKGKAISEENTLVLAAKLVLKKALAKEKIIVANLSSTMALEDIAEEFDGTVERSAVGEINVVELMLEKDALIGGEGNGGVILPYNHRGRDSLLGISLILQLLAEENQSLSKIMKDIPQYSIIKDKVECKKIDVQQFQEKLEEIDPPDSVDTIDGLKFSYKDYWVHMRPSNTEPIIRIIVEAKTEAKAKELLGPFVNFFKNI